MRITTPITRGTAVAITGATPGALDALLTGTRRMLAAGPVGSGKVTSDGAGFLWTRNPDTVHSSLRRYL